RIKEQPRDFQAHLQLGIVLFKEKDYVRAEKHLLAAKEILPHYTAYPSPSRVLTQLYKDRGQEEKYWQEMEYLVKYHQHDAQSPLLLSERAMEAEDFEQAEYYLKRAIAVDPYRLAIHRQLAKLAEQRGDHDSSVREYR